VHLERLSDETLLVLAVSEPRAFEHLYRRHVGKVVALAARHCAAPEEFHDLAASPHEGS
jgi:hypothetical protein